MNGEYQLDRAEHSILYQVFGWMSAALAITAGVAYYFSITPSLYKAFFTTPGIFFGLLILQLAIVVILSLFIMRMNFIVALLTFLGYSALNGVIFSFIFIRYTEASIGVAFLITAGMFAFMALYGFFTKADLSGMGSFLLMGLFGLIIALLVNMFLKNPALDYIISSFGVIIFSLLTAYDVQRIKFTSHRLLGTGAPTAHVALVGALQLYLDFINLFLYILRFVGQERK